MTYGNEHTPPGFDNLNQFIAPRRFTESQWRKWMRTFFHTHRAVNTDRRRRQA